MTGDILQQHSCVVLDGVTEMTHHKLVPSSVMNVKPLGSVGPQYAYELGQQMDLHILYL